MDYTKGEYESLPADDTDLDTSYTGQDYTDVSVNDSVRVSQGATNNYAIHQFKNDVDTSTIGWLVCNLQSTIAPSVSAVYLQIYNRDTTAWETVDSNNTANADTDFTLTYYVSDFTDYKDVDNIVSCRVYQLMV